MKRGSTRRVLSLIIAMCLCISTFVSSSANTQLQQVFVSAFALTQAQRQGLVDDVLRDINKTNQELIPQIKNYITGINDTDLGLALDNYRSRTGTIRPIIEEQVLAGFTNNTNYTGFDTIVNKINKMVTGDENNRNGFNFVVTMLKNMSMISKDGVVGDLEGISGKINFYYNGLYKDELSAIMPNVQSLPDSASGSVDNFLKAATDAINNLDVPDEVVKFKMYLIQETLGYGTIYKGVLSSVSSISPFKQMMLVVFSTSQQEREYFVTNVLNKIGVSSNQEVIDTTKQFLANVDKRLLLGVLFNVNSIRFDEVINEYKGLSTQNKELIKSLIQAGATNIKNYAGIENVVKKINTMVTGVESNNSGFNFAITMMICFATAGETTAYDLNDSVGKIHFKYDGPRIAEMNKLFPYVEKVGGPTYEGVDAFLTAAETALNNAISENEIKNFKIYLLKHNLFTPIYSGKAEIVVVETPVVTPTSTVVPSTSPSASPTSTVVPSTSPSASPTSTVVPSTSPSVSPTSTVVPSTSPSVSPTSTSVSSTPTATAKATTSSGGGNGGGGGTVATATATATATSTATATATPTSTVAVTPTEVIKDSDKQITSFDFKGVNESKVIIFENIHTIFVKVPENTNLRNLEPIIKYKGASIRPESGKKKNFNNPVFYTVTAKDKSKAKYVVMVVKGIKTVVVEPPMVKPGFGPFGDVYGHWAEERIISMIENGFVAGYPDGSIKPDSQMTRAEVVATLIKSLGIEVPKDANLSFKDKKAIPSWAKGYIKLALDKGIVKGYPDGTFKAMSKVTRAEFIVMTMRAYGIKESKASVLKFKDKNQIAPTWALGYITKAFEMGLITGYTDNTLRPNRSITRAEVFTICDKYLMAIASTNTEDKM